MVKKDIRSQNRLRRTEQTQIIGCMDENADF